MHHTPIDFNYCLWSLSTLVFKQWRREISTGRMQGKSVVEREIRNFPRDISERVVSFRKNEELIGCKGGGEKKKESRLEVQGT